MKLMRGSLKGFHECSNQVPKGFHAERFILFFVSLVSKLFMTVSFLDKLTKYYGSMNGLKCSDGQVDLKPLSVHSGALCIPLI